MLPQFADNFMPCRNVAGHGFCICLSKDPRGIKEQFTSSSSSHAPFASLHINTASCDHGSELLIIADQKRAVLVTCCLFKSENPRKFRNHNNLTTIGGCTQDAGRPLSAGPQRERDLVFQRSAFFSLFDGSTADAQQAGDQHQSCATT